MRQLAFAILTWCTACGDNETALTRERACQAQAYAWCRYIQGGSGCWYSYVYPCALPDPMALIRESLQAACLDAMATIAPALPSCAPVPPQCLPGPVPPQCRALWATRAD
jgi:hypothetical protein